MKRAVRIGFIDAIISSVSYGLYPLFAILLYNTGSSVSNSLFYRYLFAFLIYLYILKVHKKINLSVTVKEFIILFFVGITFAVSSIALFAALKYIDSGIACTIVFVYPVIVALIMTLFFHEKLTKTTVVFLGIFVFCLRCDNVCDVYDICKNRKNHKTYAAGKSNFLCYAFRNGFLFYMFKVRVGFSVAYKTESMDICALFGGNTYDSCHRNG